MKMKPPFPSNEDIFFSKLSGNSHVSNISRRETKKSGKNSCPRARFGHATRGESRKVVVSKYDLSITFTRDQLTSSLEFFTPKKDRVQMMRFSATVHFVTFQILHLIFRIKRVDPHPQRVMLFIIHLHLCDLIYS